VKGVLGQRHTRPLVRYPQGGAYFLGATTRSRVSLGCVRARRWLCNRGYFFFTGVALGLEMMRDLHSAERVSATRPQAAQ